MNARRRPIRPVMVLPIRGLGNTMSGTQLLPSSLAAGLVFGFRPSPGLSALQLAWDAACRLVSVVNLRSTPASRAAGVANARPSAGIRPVRPAGSSWPARRTPTSAGRSRARCPRPPAGNTSRKSAAAAASVICSRRKCSRGLPASSSGHATRISSNSHSPGARLRCRCIGSRRSVGAARPAAAVGRRRVDRLPRRRRSCVRRSRMSFSGTRNPGPAG